MIQNFLSINTDAVVSAFQRQKKTLLPSTIACTLLEYSCSVVTAPHIQQSGVGSTPGLQLIPQKLG
jgi:hypothetical protein